MITLGVSLPSAKTACIAFSRLLASMLKVSSSTSTKTGVAPRKETTSEEAKKVKSGMKTASPALMSQAMRSIRRASVPLPQVMQCFTPT